MGSCVSNNSKPKVEAVQRKAPPRFQRTVELHSLDGNDLYQKRRFAASKRTSGARTGSRESSAVVPEEYSSAENRISTHAGLNDSNNKKNRTVITSTCTSLNNVPEYDNIQEQKRHETRRTSIERGMNHEDQNKLPVPSRFRMQENLLERRFMQNAGIERTVAMTVGEN